MRLALWVGIFCCLSQSVLAKQNFAAADIIRNWKIDGKDFAEIKQGDRILVTVEINPSAKGWELDYGRFFIRHEDDKRFNGVGYLHPKKIPNKEGWIKLERSQPYKDYMKPGRYETNIKFYDAEGNRYNAAEEKFGRFVPIDGPGFVILADGQAPAGEAAKVDGDNADETDEADDPEDAGGGEDGGGEAVIRKWRINNEESIILKPNQQFQMTLQINPSAKGWKFESGRVFVRREGDKRWTGIGYVSPKNIPYEEDWVWIKRIQPRADWMKPGRYETGIDFVDANGKKYSTRGRGELADAQGPMFVIKNPSGKSLDEPKPAEPKPAPAPEPQAAGAEPTMKNVTAGAVTQWLAGPERLELGFGKDGKIAAVRIDGAALPAAETAGGFYIHDVASGKAPELLEGALKDGAFTGQSKDQGLKVTADLKAVDGRLRVEAEVQDLTGEDRAVNVGLRLPFDATGWTWWRQIIEPQTIEPNETYRVWATSTNVGSRGDSVAIPVGAVSPPDGRAGLSLAVPPDCPRISHIDYRDGCFDISFDMGLSKDTAKFPSKASYCVDLYLHEAEWGLRDALRRYYAFYPAYFEVRGSGRGGAWLVARSPSQIDTPEMTKVLGGPLSPYFAYRHVYSSSSTTDAAESLEKGIETYAFFICRANFRHFGGTLPFDAAGALERLEAYGTPELKGKAYFPGYWGDFWHRNTADIRESVKNSLLRGPDGEIVMSDMSLRTKKDGERAFLAYAVNVDPDLYGDSEKNKLTAAQSYLEYMRIDLEKVPNLAGFYSDYMHPLGMYDNYDREHFKTTDYPLCYDAKTKRVCIHNRFSLLEFYDHLWKLARDPKSFFYGKKIFSNSIKNFDGGRAFLGFRSDVAGQELGPNHMDLDRFFYFGRVVAYQKPTLVLANARPPQDPDKYPVSKEEMAKRLKRTAFLGIPDSITALTTSAPLMARFAEDFKTCVGLAGRLQEAGWEPVTYARVTEGCMIERFGSLQGTNLHFSVLNPSAERKVCEIAIDLKGIEFPPGYNPVVRELTRDKTAPLQYDKETMRVIIRDRIDGDDWRVFTVGPDL